jgi:hypothetical protein
VSCHGPPASTKMALEEVAATEHGTTRTTATRVRYREGKYIQIWMQIV